MVAQNKPPKHKKNQQQPAVYEDDIQVPKKKRQNQKDHARFGIKYYYNDPSAGLIGQFINECQHSDYVDVICKSTIGPALRIPIGRIFYLQTEALFGLYSDWAGAMEKQGFWDQMTYCYSNRTGSFMLVPVYVGARWAPVKIFAVKGFAGPRFNFLINNGSFSFGHDQYSLVGGAGVDLLRVFSFEMGYQIGMRRFSPVENSGGWFVAASMMF